MLKISSLFDVALRMCFNVKQDHSFARKQLKDGMFIRIVWRGI